MAKSVCLIGKIQHVRGNMLQITNVDIENTTCDLIVETSLPQLGKTAWVYTTPVSVGSNQLMRHALRVTGHNHTLHILNRFNLVNVEVTLTANGAR